MTNDEMKGFALSLAKADKEKEVVKILKESGYWNDDSAWREYGDNSMNFSIIANQSGFADHALVEKLINSVDAVLMRECWSRGIAPDSAGAPKNIAEAQRKFFGIRNGKLSSMDGTQRARLADNILLVASGSKTKPSFSIIDKGEGQTPNSMPKTILSLTKENKIKIPFVQGKFGMGGTGVLRFCSSEHHLQLLISKRNVNIRDHDEDPTKAFWGVTIIRQEEPKEGMRNSHYTYLAPEGRILSFEARALPLLPKAHPRAFGNPLESGTYVKLYEYEIGPPLPSIIAFALYYRLSLLMPDVALPIRMFERRDYEGHAHEKTLAGLSVRLDDDRSGNLEPEFQKPSTGEITIDGEKFNYSIYVFKKGKKGNYARNEGIVFSINGQAHGFLQKRFFERKAVGMSYLSDSILIVMDCSKISRKMQEKLFMPSRDRLARTSFLSDIEKELESIIKTHPGLKDLQSRRREETLSDKLRDSKRLDDLLTDIIKKDPTLSNLLLNGGRIPNPFKTKGSGTRKKFQGKKFPTYFVLDKSYTEDSPKGCAINRNFRVQYQTDAENDYFNRDQDQGKFTLKLGGSVIRGSSLNLWNGLASLTVNLPKVDIGDLRCFETEVSDISKVEPFLSEFWIRVEKASKSNNSNGNGRKDPPSDEEGEKRQRQANLDIPQVVEIREERWEEFKFNKESSLQVKGTGEGNGYDFYVNMDNVYLRNELSRNELKGNAQADSKILEERYKTGMVLLGMSLLHFDENHAENNNGSDPDQNGVSVYDRISEFTQAVSLVLLPMIASLGTLESET